MIYYLAIGRTLFSRSSWLALLIAHSYTYVQVRDSPVTSYITALDCSYIVTGLGVTMRCDCVALRVVYFSVAVRLNGHLCRAVAEVPNFTALSGAKAANLKGDFIAGFNAQGGIIGGVNGGRYLVWVVSVDYLNHCKIIINVP